MKARSVVRKLLLLLSILMILTSSVQGTMAFIVTKTGSITNIFIPFRHLLGDLLLTKSVEHSLGEGYVIPDHIAFDFDISLGTAYAGVTVNTSLGDKVADSNGVIRVSVKPGTSLYLHELEEGTKVTVTEVSDLPGFTAKEGATVKEAVVAQDGTVTIHFVNIYQPSSVQPVNLTLNGNKVLEGRPWQEGDSFTFLLEQKVGENDWRSLGTKTITYDPSSEDFSSFSFTDVIQAIEFDSVGNYLFRISETVGNLEDMAYDKTVNTFRVVVSDKDMDGKLEIGSVTASQNATVSYDEDAKRYDLSVTFNNTYIPPELPDPEDITVTIRVEKTVVNTGSTSIGPDGFEFLLACENDGSQLAMKSDENGHTAFTLKYTVDDINKTFTYRLSEVNGGVAGVTYDARIYEISVTVTLDEETNTLVATMSCDDFVSPGTATFKNTFHAVTPPTGDDGGLSFWIIIFFAGVILLLGILVTDPKKPLMKS